MKRFKTLPFIFAMWLGWGGFALAQGADDPFAGVTEKEASAEKAGDFFSDNFGFRKEIMSQFSLNGRELASRQSLGFEVLKKFSSETATFAALDFQGRLVRRDGSAVSLNDMEGMNRPGWVWEYHNAYLDLYNPFGGIGGLNFRAGRFYLPFGLNLQTDTHGTILQLSNEMNFGFERDWLAGFWGALTEDLNYDLYYLAGSGYDLKFMGQGGLAAARLSLGNRVASDAGLEGGLSLIGGGRLLEGSRVETLRAGLDGRVRGAIEGGLLTWTSELSAGRDETEGLFTQLYQLDYLNESRRWGLAVQYRRFQWEAWVDASLLAEATWYLRNDVGSSNLQWIKLNLEWKTEPRAGDKNLILTTQYYQYW